MKKNIILIILNLAIIAAGVATAVAIMSMGHSADEVADQDLITVYNEMGETKLVPYDMADKYEDEGWYTFEPVFLYDASGKRTPVAKEVVEELMRNGWTDTPSEQSKNNKDAGVSEEENKTFCELCGSVYHSSNEHPDTPFAE